MKIKKFEARTEKDAIEKVKNELGPDALILNIKTIQPRGFFAIFRKPTVEVTAAFEEKQQNHGKKRAKKDPSSEVAATKEETEESVGVDFFKNLEKDKTIVNQQELISSLEQKVRSQEELLQKIAPRLMLSNHSLGEVEKYDNKMLQLFYDSLVEQGVTKEIAEKLLEEASQIEPDINLIVKIVYNTIINVIGEATPIDFEGDFQNEPRVINFIGPTGVGKTTTIAKLTSHIVLNKNMRVGLITADTYRIAAVEQLKTYAEILGLDVGVVFNASDLVSVMEEMHGEKDFILVDTAGRSHKNADSLEELYELLEVNPSSENFLVLSVTTRYEDLINIVKTYESVADFKIIFTKLDETQFYGSILNICYLTGKKVSYITTGQNVPEDIEVLQPEKIAKALLGFGGDVF